MKLVQELPEVFEEFGEQRRKSFLEIKEYKEKGYSFVGMYCAYFPPELAMAVGAIPVGLCSFSNETVVEAERELPKSMCPLVKSSYGFAITDKCPYFHFSDLVIGETTCDGKKKMYELMAEFKPVFVMELPNSQSETSLVFWKQEIIRTKEYLEEFFNVVITDQNLKDAIHLQNRIRSSLKRLCEVMKLDPAPVLGADIQRMVTGSKYRFDYHTTPEVVDSVTRQILDEYDDGKKLEHRPRILVTGCPIGGDSLKIIEAIERNGGVVVAVENCNGVKTLDQMVDEEDPDIYHAIAKRYLSTGCFIMTPNDNRIELLGRLISEYKADGVVEMILTGCHAAGAESIYIRKFVTDEKKLPYIAIDTTYSSEDTAQIDTRFSAFLELITAKKEDLPIFDMNRCYKILFSNLVESENMSEVLEQLWEYTKVPIIILDANNQIQYSAGCEDTEDWKQSENKVEINIEQGSGRIIGVSPIPQLTGKVEVLLSNVKKIYMMKEKSQKKNQENESELQGERQGMQPDYLWILASDNRDGVQLKNHLASSFQVKVVERAGRSEKRNDAFAILISNIEGKTMRDELIDDCRRYAEEREVQIVLGNGFHDLGKKDANKSMLDHVWQIIDRKDAPKKVHLLEEYYRELSLEYINKKISKTGYFPKELSVVKAEDQEKGGNLYETLYYYLLMKRNALKTAAKLKIHRNTLIGRISSINKLIQLDEKDGMECEQLLLAMQLERVG